MSKNLAIELEKMVELKNSAYSERNKCVALIARMAIALGLKAGRVITAIEGWDEEWHNCVYIDLPSGQVSWHYHSGESAQFAALPEYHGKWDGHTTDEKYDRVNKAFAQINGSYEGEDFVNILGDLNYKNQTLRRDAEEREKVLLKENARLKKLLTDFYKNASLDSSTEHCAGISADVESWFAIQEFVTNQPDYNKDEE